MTYTTSRNIMLRKFHAMLRELNIMDQKEAVLEGYGVESTRDLSDNLLEDAIRQLVRYRDGAKASTRKLRSEILCILQALGIYQNNNSWSRVNEYLLNPKIAGKLLFQLDDEELTALRIKLNSILSKQEIKAQTERKAALNN